jgi:hypothetical protein
MKTLDTLNKYCGHGANQELAMLIMCMTQCTREDFLGHAVSKTKFLGVLKENIKERLTDDMIKDWRKI